MVIDMYPALAAGTFFSSPWWRTWVLPLGGSFLIAAWLTGLLVKIAPRRGWVATPRQDRWNVRVVAQFGGLPILLGFSITACCFFPTRQNLLLIFLTWGVGLVGLADDIARLSPKAKLVGQGLMAAVAVYSGVSHPLTAHPWINGAFTVFWIVGITNAINLLDNMDGLAAGISIIAAGQIVFLAGVSNPVSELALCMLAAITGFLIFNVNPARVFMGDVGALSIGFFLGCGSVRTAEHLSSLTSVLFVPCLILFIPVFDTLLVSITRRIRGRRISLGARDHASHRLVLIGLSERQAVSLLYVIAATAGLMSFLWKSSWGDLGAGIVALFLIGSSLFWVYLAKLELPTNWLSPQDTRLAAMPHYLAQVIAGIFFILLDAAVICLGLYFAYLVKFERLDRVLLGRFLFSVALVLVIKLPLLVILAAYDHKWSVARRRDMYPVLKAAILAACLLTAVSVALPRSKTIESSVILFDAVFTTLLLVLCRASGRIFDDLFGTKHYLDLTMKRLTNSSRLRPSDESCDKASVGEMVTEEDAARDRTSRPN